MAESVGIGILVQEMMVILLESSAVSADSFDKQIGQ